MSSEVKEITCLPSLPDVLEGFTPAQSKSASYSGKGILSIVNSLKNGRRIVFSKYLNEMLGSPIKVFFRFNDSEVAIFADLDDTNESLVVNQSKGKGTVYSADLVKEITNLYQLDFSSKVSTKESSVMYKQRKITSPDDAYRLLKEFLENPIGENLLLSAWILRIG